MTNATQPPPVTDNEVLARFIRVKDWVRADQTVRQDAFIPPRDMNLSVTRHLGLSETELWRIGQRVVTAIATKTKAALHGRADITVRQVSPLQPLRTVAAPLPDNPNHAHVTAWPLDKSARKNLAQKLALACGKYVPAP